MRFSIELPFSNIGNPKWPARLTGRTNAPGRLRKQIQLQYAGIGGGYGWTSSSPLAPGTHSLRRQLLTSAFNRLDTPPFGRRPLIEIVDQIEKRSEHKPAFAFEDLSPVQTSGVRRIDVVQLIGPAIGLRYAPIFNPYLSQTPLYGSGAPRSKSPRLHENERAAILLSFKF